MVGVPRRANRHRAVSVGGVGHGLAIANSTAAAISVARSRRRSPRSRSALARPKATSSASKRDDRIARLPGSRSPRGCDSDCGRSASGRGCDRSWPRSGSAPARARPLDRAKRGVGDDGEIVAVDDLARHGIGAGARRRRCATAVERAIDDRHRVLVVLADEDDRQLPDRGEVERLVESALVVGAVAEKGDRDRALSPPLGAERRADRDRQAAADDAIGAEIAVGSGRRCASSRRAPCNSRSRGRGTRRTSASARRPWRCNGRGRDGSR